MNWKVVSQPGSHWGITSCIQRLCLCLKMDISTKQQVLFDLTVRCLQTRGWNLREVSLIHQGVLVIAEVSWDPQTSEPSVYLVTWQLQGGGLKGSLLTDSTCVTLSLWPDTLYHIQVQYVCHLQFPRGWVCGPRGSSRLVCKLLRASPNLSLFKHFSGAFLLQIEQTFSYFIIT